MTFGIAVSGPGAGRAAFAALRAVEAVGRGAIGGFAVFAAIDAEGRLHRAETQRGGGATLFGGGGPPPELARAPLAALMSSGPDRPEPLSRFLPADPAVGLVTGHRLPHLPGADGRPVNAAALERVAAGEAGEAAVAAFRASDPESDAGLVVMDATGRIALGNSALVDRRDDAGRALVSDTGSGLTIGLLHNSIHPAGGIAALAVAAAIDAVAPADAADLCVALTGCPLVMGPANVLHLDAARRPERIEVTNPAWIGPAWEGSAVLRGAEVRIGGAPAGRVVGEPYCHAHDGVVTGGHGGDAAAVHYVVYG